ncbi:MAG TPA: FadR/GntR family transcriptional regulator [Gaiellaceae bacterium]|nr:FadR/GntR family transcriptional regulator [Gaiellaceae bacterium]
MVGQAGYRPVDRSGGLAELVSEQIVEMISAGELGAGQQLPPERVLAERFQVSRNVVREALRSLAAMNVVEVRHGVGAFVASLDIASLVEPLALAVSLERGAFTSLTEARLVLEPGIAALAATRATDADVAALEHLLHESQHSVDEPAHFLTADIALHDRIVQMANNPVLARVHQGIARLAQASRELTNLSASMRALALRDHAEIVGAIGRRDPAAAEQAMRSHLEHVRETLEREASAA